MSSFWLLFSCFVRIPVNVPVLVQVHCCSVRECEFENLPFDAHLLSERVKERRQQVYCNTTVMHRRDDAVKWCRRGHLIRPDK